MNYWLYLQSLSFYITWYSFSIIFAIVCLPLLIKASWTLAAVKLWAKISLILLKTFNQVEVNYITDIAIHQRGQIIACRHESVLEILILLAHIPNTVFVYKAELKWIPIVNLYLHRLKCISVNRAYKNNGVIAATLQLLDTHNVIIFPEGMRVNHGYKSEHKAGVSVLYKHIHEQKLPYKILLANTNAGKYWPKNTFVKHAGVCTVHVSNEFISNSNNIDILKEQMREKIEMISLE